MLLNKSLKGIKRDKAINTLLANKLLTMKIAIESSLHSTLLNPTEILFSRIHGPGYYKSDLHQKTIKYRIFYSILIYFIIFLGFIYSIKNKLFYFHILLLTSMYFFAISSWVGYTRYFVPTYISLCLYFACGTYYLYCILSKMKIKNK